MPVTLPPPTPKKKGLTSSQWVAAAKAGTVTWDQARAGIISTGTTPAAAATLIATAQAPPTARPKAPKGPTAAATLTALTKKQITPDVAKKQLLAGGYTSQAADQMIQSELTPNPATLTTSQILEGVKTGTLKTDQATDLLRTNGLDDTSISILLRTEQTQFDRWAVMGADGKVKFVTISDPSVPPKNVLHYGPTPLTQTSFTQTWTQQYKDNFFAYTGRQATGQEVADILAKAPSIYTLTTGLAANKPVSQITGVTKTVAGPGHIGTPSTRIAVSSPAVDFTKSPIYKQHAGALIADAKQILGDSWKPNTALISQAIAQNWDQGTFEAKIRELPSYLSGPEFKDGAAKKGLVYQAIYGTPDENALHTIGQAQLAGWTNDEFASYLRAQPQYTKSSEYMGKLLSFGQALGLITGQQPGVVTGGSKAASPQENPYAGTGPKLTQSDRLPKAGPVQSPLNYAVTGV